MIYYIKENEIADGPLDHTVANNHYKIQPILFLSKLLTGAESRYWPTELKITYLVQIIRKIRHLILESTSPTIVYIDYSTIISIIKQYTLSLINTDRLNLRFIRASLYLSQFPLNIKYRPGPQNIIPDTLSRLLKKIIDDPKTSDRDDVLENINAHHNDANIVEDIYAYNYTVVKISADFRDKVKTTYSEDIKWQEIYQQLRYVDNSIKSFTLDDDDLI